MQDYIVSYGSLINSYSRLNFSQIEAPVFPAMLNGWCRSWCAQYPDEGATYAGAITKRDASMYSVLVPTTITDEIRHRERFYDILEVNPENIHPFNAEHSNLLTNNNKFWVFKTRTPTPPTKKFPLPQSYVDTCLIGCLENGGIEQGKLFVDQTEGWDCEWINDRSVATQIFPRAQPIDDAWAKEIDEILLSCNVLKFRTESFE